jgi:hypothetical protein
MASNTGPSVITNGLVAYWDFNNNKSLAGGPITNSQYNSGSEISPWTAGGINTDVTSTSIGQSAPVPQSKTWKFEKTGTSNQWNGWESTYGGIWTGSSGDYWTTSYWYKTNAPAGNTGFGVGSFFTPDWSRSYNTTLIDNVSSIIADGEWHYNYTVVRLNEAYSNAIIVDGPSWGYSASPGVLYINGLQWNKNSYATHWVPGTYTASQALRDLTNNRTTSTLNLSYPQGSGRSSSYTHPYLTSYAGTTTVSVDSSSILDTDTHSIFFMIRFNTTSAHGANGYSGNWDMIFQFASGGSDRSPGIWRWPGERSLHWRYDPSNTGCDFGKTSGGLGDQFDIDTWYYVGVTKNGGTATMYVNGLQVGTSGVSNPKSSGTAPVTLFPYYPQDLATMGLCHIYNRTLSSDEVFANFSAIRSRYGI